MPSRRVVLVEYVCTDHVTLVFGARADWPEPKVIEIPTSLDTIRRFVVDHFNPHAIGSDQWRTFVAPFLDPIREWACEGDLLWLVPHDALHYLPLHAFELDGRPLTRRHPIVYSPSAAIMKYCQARRTGRARQRAVVFGDSRDDLPFAREEARMVAERFDAEAILGAQATRDCFLAHTQNADQPFDILHLACHGSFDAGHPLESGIKLAPDGDKTAQLTVEEIFGLELGADLVVLGACESGVNDRRAGDELIGLTRALIYAGAPSVLVSLWRVDDLSTLILMDAFYDGLAHGLNKAEALQQAQCRVMTLDEAAAYGFVRARADALKRGGQLERAQRLEQLAYDSLLEAQDVNPRPAGGAPWRPFSLPVRWAPFVLVGDWR